MTRNAFAFTFLTAITLGCGSSSQPKPNECVTSEAGGNSICGDGSDSRGGNSGRISSNGNKGGVTSTDPKLSVSGGPSNEGTMTSSGGVTSFGGTTSTVGSSFGGSTVQGGTTNLGGTTSTTVLSVGGTTQGGTTSSTSTSTNVVVDNGAQCSPVAARGCSSENKVAQMVCSAGNVWQWSADCATGTVCDPRPGLKVGQCVTPDARCVNPIGPNCERKSGIVYTCGLPGIVEKKEACVSAECYDEKTCSNWAPCVSDWRLIQGNFDCTGLCNVTLSSACASPINGGKNGLLFPSEITWELTVGVPPASALPTIEACPNVHVFWVWLKYQTRNKELPLLIPSQYKAVIVQSSELETAPENAAKAGCDLPSSYVSPSAFNPYKGQAVMLVTEDANAPSFRLALVTL